MKARVVSGSLSLMIALGSLGADLYVAPTGKDSNLGTQAQPLATLLGARDAVRKLNKSAKGDIVVEFADGLYRVEKTIFFGPQDSGAGGRKVIYTAASGAKPILSGGISVTGWEVHDPAKNIYCAKTTTTPFRQLYVNDALAIRARHPNRESEKDNSPYWECKVPAIPKMRIKQEYWQPCSQVPESKRAEIEMVMICHWYHQRIRVGTVKTVGKEVEITPAQPNKNFSKTQVFYTKSGFIDNPFHFENALEFIDAPYEWYQDANKGMVYMAFPKDVKPDAVRVEIPIVETVIAVEGTAAEPVRDIEFRGLTVKLTNWNKPSTFGINMTQAAQAQGCESPPAMIFVKHSQRLAFRNNTFAQAGGQGLELYNADLTDVEGNTFRTIAANGIMIDRGTGSNPAPDKQSVGIAIWNNDASTCGSHYSNGMFLFASNVKKLTVAHNHIYNLPYSGMQIGQQPGGIRGKEYTDVGCGENTIINNLIHHCNQIHGDGGGIYTLGGVQKGTLISGNFVHDTVQPKWDRYHVSQIYLDNNSSKITVRDNVTKGGAAEERNGSAGNFFANNTQSNPAIEKNTGLNPGYNPRKAEQ
jgi:Right handed beta helix region